MPANSSTARTLRSLPQGPMYSAAATICGTGKPLSPRPLQMPPFLPGRRPVPPRPQRRQPTPPPRQLVMPLQIHRQARRPLPCLGRALHDPAAGRSALLGVKAIGDGHVHDAIGPVGPGEARPIRTLAPAANSHEHSPPERIASAVRRCSAIRRAAGVKPVGSRRFDQPAYAGRSSGFGFAPTIAGAEATQITAAATGSTQDSLQPLAHRGPLAADAGDVAASRFPHCREPPRIVPPSAAPPARNRRRRGRDSSSPHANAGAKLPPVAVPTSDRPTPSIAFGGAFDRPARLPGCRYPPTAR